MSIKMRQLIIVRKDLHMSPGKFAAQCCHASIALLTRPLKDRAKLTILDGIKQVSYGVDKNIYANWICGIFTNLTELEPEELDENGVGRVLTCIGV